MKKLTFALILGLFSSNTCAMNNSAAPSRIILMLENCHDTMTLKPLFNFNRYLDDQLKILEPFSQQDMVSGLFFAIEHIQNQKIVSHLFQKWENDMDINIPIEHHSYLGMKQILPAPLLNVTMYRLTYVLSRGYEPNEAQCFDCYYQFLLHAYNKLKNKINVNIRYNSIVHNDSCSATPLMILFKNFIESLKDSSTFILFTEDFLKEFQNYIDFFAINETGETVFQICNIKEKDDSLVVARKEYVLSLLKKYCPQKLSFTKKGLEKTHNCSFIFSAKRMYDEI